MGGVSLAGLGTLPGGGADAEILPISIGSI